MDFLSLVAKLSLDSSEYESGLEKAKGLVSGVGGAIGTGFKVAGAAIGAATTAVTGFAASSVNVGKDFDSSMSQVAATMGVTVDEIKDLRDFAQDMGAKTAFSATQAAEALNYMALAGYDADDSMQMLPNVLNLAAAGGMELASASDMITDSQSALGLSFDETTELVDKMAKAASKTNTSVSQLGDAILTVGGTAKNLSGGTTELTQVLGLMADNGIKASESGTHLRNILLAMTPSSDAAAAAMEQIGLQAYDSEGKMRPLEDIFLEMGDAMKDMSDYERNNIISAIFNKTDLAAVNALLSTTKGRWDEVENAIDNAKGASEEMANTQLDNLEGDITLFKSALEGAQILVSDKLTPSLREFVQFGTSGLTQVSDAFKEGGVTGAMEAFGGVLSDGLTMVTSKLPDFVKAGIDLLEALGKGIIENAPVLFTALVEIGGMLREKALEILTNASEALKDADWAGMAQQFVDFLKEGMGNAGDFLTIGLDIIMSIFNGIVESLPVLLEGAADIISSLADGLSQSLPTLIPQAVAMIGELAQALTEPSTLVSILNAAVQIAMALAQGLLNAIPELLRQAPIIISNLVGAIVGALPTVISAGVQILNALITGILGMLPDLIALAPRLILALVGGIVQGIATIIKTGKQLVDGFVTGIKNAWTGAVTNIITFFTGLIDRVKALFGIHSPSKVFSDIGKNLIQGMIDGIKGMISKLKDKAKDILDVFKELPKKVVDIGKNIIEGVWEGMSAATDWIKQKITGWVGDVLSFFKTLFGIHSPSAVMRDLIGVNLGKGVAEGIEASIPAVEDAMGDMSSIIEAPQFENVSTVGSGYNSSASVLAAMGTEQNKNKELTVILELDKAQLGRAVYQLNNDETQRVGLRLAGGFA